MDIDKYYSDKIKNYNFATEACRNIKIELLLKAEKIIDKKNTINYFYNLIKDYLMARDIEKGIFEYTLFYIISESIDDSQISNIYNDKVHSIYENLNPSGYLKNVNFVKNLKNGVIKPEYIAFFSPQQLYPEKWEHILKKNKLKEDVENNLGVTDIYKCNRCGERKCRISELQIRSADEPINKFITCTVCYKTFII